MLATSFFVTPHPDWDLVALSGAVCFLASIVAISLFHRAELSSGRERWIWLGLDAAAAGYGVWATKFIALLADEATLGSAYDLSLIILSLFLSILLMGTALFISAWNFSRLSAAVGGIVAGLGIAAVHFTGVLALQLQGSITWSPTLIGAATTLGAGLGALTFLISRRHHWSNMIGAASLGMVTLLSVHFIVVPAMRFVPDPTLSRPDATSLSAATLSILVAGAAAIILGMCLVAALSDRQSKDKLRQQKLLLDCALENISQGLCMYDAGGRILMFNERYTKLWGLPAASLHGKSLKELLALGKARGEFEGDPDTYLAQLSAQLAAGNPISEILQVQSGHTLRVIDRPMQGGGWVTTIEDITDWVEAQAQIAHMARHDALTDLPNRTLFRERLEQALRAATRQGQFAVFCIDLDHFKDVNDSLGHPMGDELLKEVSRRLTECVRKGDTVARLGGDEFAIVQVGGDRQPAAASALAQRLVEVIGLPYDIQGQQVIIGTSIGISVAPTDGIDPDELLKNADLALYLAKSNGRGAYRFFETGMDARAQARRVMMLDLRTALERDEFVIYYQPIYDTESESILCFEALVRWNHPLRGLMEPTSFIPLAEETGLIVALGDWVLRRACMDAASWSQDVCVAVNLSTIQFKNRNLVASVLAALGASGLAPHRLELEITESVLLQDNDTTLTALHKLRSFGVQISMDDFGTGYSSLSYLRSFPFDKIKIDRSFVAELSVNHDSMAIIRCVTGLGKSLGIATIAEGVETSEQLALLRTEGCSEVQGFLFSQPRPAKEVETMLANGRQNENFAQRTNWRAS